MPQRLHSNYYLSTFEPREYDSAVPKSMGADALRFDQQARRAGAIGRNLIG
jgi:hypothetical protein